MPYLIQKKLDGTLVKQWDLRDHEVVFGRGEDLEGSVPDAQMSRRHFSLLPRAGDWVLQDLKSTNGTKVNGQPVTEVVLKANDKIRTGQTLFVFTDGLATVMGKLEKDGKGLDTYLKELR